MAVSWPRISASSSPWPDSQARPDGRLEWKTVCGHITSKEPQSVPRPSARTATTTVPAGVQEGAVADGHLDGARRPGRRR